MKLSPEMQRLEQVLRSGRLVAGGFMGGDPRTVVEVIEADLAELETLGRSAREIARRMRELSDLARPYFGTPVQAGPDLEITTEEHRGMVVCPWPHPANFRKSFTTARRLDTKEEVRWTDLSIHLIEAHQFFQGRGSHFRLEPAALVRIIF